MDTIYAHNAAGLVSLAAARDRGGNRVDNAMYCGWQAGNAVTSTLKSTTTFTTPISHNKAWRPKESSP